MAWTSDSTGRWAHDWVGWGGFSRFFSQLVSWTFPGEETGGIEARFDSTGGRTTLHVESVEPDGSARDFYDTSAVVVSPDFTSANVDLVQIAPGVYEVPLGEIDPGAYAVRVTQTRAGTTPLGRTVGLVAPTAAEYRVLGANEPFLSAVRTATGGTEVLTPLDPWVHDLDQTSRFTDLWPLLLVLALLLWPLDIALRRVSVGRREFAAAGAWVRALPRRRSRVAARTTTGEGLLAARERASSSETRAALRAPVRRGRRQRRRSRPRRPRPRRRTCRRDAAPAPTAVRARSGRRRHPPPTPASRATPHPPADDGSDTMARLRDAKRRARER